MEIEKRVSLIFDDCCDLSYGKETEGLLTGKWGRILFIYNYVKLYNKGHEYFENILADTLKESVNASNLTFADGLSGIGWSICYLINEGILYREDCAELLSEIDKLLLARINDFDQNKDFDFLYGIIGIGNYFLIRKNNDAIDIIIAKLNTWSENAGSGKRWASKIYVNKEKQTAVYDMGLAHGQQSIINFLVKCLEKNLKKTVLADALLKNAIEFIYNQSSKIDGFFYPAYITKDENKIIRNSRLAWCYGDLVMSLSLLKAATHLKDEPLKKHALEIALNTLKYDNPSVVHLNDAGFCHGTAGVSYLYKKLYYHTKNENFKNAYNYWLNKTMEFAVHNDGIGGYKTWHTDTGWYNEKSLLEGATGIGIVLMNSLSEDPGTWDQCFLI